MRHELHYQQTLDGTPGRWRCSCGWLVPKRIKSESGAKAHHAQHVRAEAR